MHAPPITQSSSMFQFQTGSIKSFGANTIANQAWVVFQFQTGSIKRQNFGNDIGYPA